MLFRMNHPVSKFYMLALAALFAVVVSGCSSSGGGSDPVSMAPPTTPDPDPEPDPMRPVASKAQVDAKAKGITASATSTTGPFYSA